MKPFSLVLIDIGVFLNNDKNKFCPEKTEGYIIDEAFNTIQTFSNVWDRGEYNEEVVEALKRYNIEPCLIGEDTTLFMGDPNSTIQQSIEKIKADIARDESIKKYLTPKKQAELLELFKKK